MPEKIVTTNYKYIPLPPNEWKNIPEVAKHRKNLAKMYRKARKESRQLAVLLRNRVNRASLIAKDQIAERIFNVGTN